LTETIRSVLVFLNSSNFSRSIELGTGLEGDSCDGAGSSVLTGVGTGSGFGFDADFGSYLL
jgi:hypothetical protein